MTWSCDFPSQHVSACCFRQIDNGILQALTESKGSQKTVKQYHNGFYGDSFYMKRIII